VQGSGSLILRPGCGVRKDTNSFLRLHQRGQATFFNGLLTDSELGEERQPNAAHWSEAEIAGGKRVHRRGERSAQSRVKPIASTTQACYYNQDPGKYLPLRAFRRFTQCLQEPLAIIVTEDDRFATVPSCHDVMD